MTRFIYHILALGFVGGMLIYPGIEFPLRGLGIFMAWLIHSHTLESLNRSIEVKELGVSYKKYLSDKEYHDNMKALEAKDKILNENISKLEKK